MLPISVVISPKFDRGLPVACKHPVPAREAGHDHAEDSIQDHNEIHHRSVLVEAVVVPERSDRHHHVHAAHHQVEHEEQEVALVLHAHAIIDPGTVMVHHVDALLADRTVVRSCRLNHLTLVTFLRPELLQLICSLTAVPQELLNMRRQSVKALIF